MAIWVKSAAFRRWIGFSEDDGIFAEGLTTLSAKRLNIGGRAALVWQRVEDNAFHLCETLALPFPKKFRRAINLRRKAFVHRTIERGLLKDLPLRMIRWERDVNF